MKQAILRSSSAGQVLALAREFPGKAGALSRLKASPSCSKLITAEETEMPNCATVALRERIGAA
jgi:hypothetical protein